MNAIHEQRELQLFNNAVALHQSGDLARAEEIYRDLLARHPRHADVLHLLGVVGLQQDKPEEAAELISRAVSERPAFPQALGNLAIAQRALGRPVDAAETYRRAARLEPANQGFLGGVCESLIEAGDAEAVRQALQDAREGGMRDPHLFGSVAAFFRAQGLAGEAVDLLAEVVSLDPQLVPGRIEYSNALRDAGRLDEALEQADAAVALLPSSSLAHLVSGLARKALAQTDGAIEAFRQVVALDPDLREGWINLGNVLAAAGQVEEAEQALARAAEQAPDDPAAQYAMAGVLIAKGDLAEAETILGDLHRAFPGNADVIRSLGSVFTRQGKGAEAEATFRKLIPLNAVDHAVLSDLATLAKEDGRLDEALHLMQTVVAKRPDDPEVLNNLGTILGDLQRLDEGIANLERAVSLRPDYAVALCNLGQLLSDQMRTEEAVERFRQALAADPENAEAHLNLGLNLLRLEQFAEGWEQYAWRFALARAAYQLRAYPQPRWAGESLEGKTLLISPEQGVGDEIMFASVLGDLRARGDVRDNGGRVIVECDVRLVPLMERAFPAFEFTAKADALNPDLMTDDIDYHAPIGDVAAILRPTAADFGDGAAFLHADPTRSDALRHKYEGLARGRKIVGIGWTSQNPVKGPQKSVGLENLKPLLSRDDCFFVNLQSGKVLDELIQFQMREGVEVYSDRTIDSWNDLDAFAAQIAAMDLVISTSNSGVHLAAALGVPTWVLVQKAAHFRWFEGRDDSLWYSAVRLFRQSTVANEAGDAATGDPWAPVVEKVVQALGDVQPDGMAGDCMSVAALPQEHADFLAAWDEPVNEVIEAGSLKIEVTGDALEDAQTHATIASAYHADGQTQLAIQHLQTACELEPENTNGLSILGVWLGEAERYEEAAEVLERATEQVTDNAIIWKNLATALFKLDRLEDSLACCDRSLALDGQYAQAHLSRAQVLEKLNRFEDSWAAAEQALALGGRDPHVIGAMSLLCKRMSRHDEAERLLREAISIMPEDPLNYLNLSLLVLRDGRFEEGWPLYQWRFRTIAPEARIRMPPEPGIHTPGLDGQIPQARTGHTIPWTRQDATGGSAPAPVRLWNGEDLTGKTVLIYAEQGIGDEVMFASCIPDLLVRGPERVWFECDPRLETLFRRAFPEVLSQGKVRSMDLSWIPDDQYPDYCLPIGDLPMFFRHKAEDFVRAPALLKADPDLHALWQERLDVLGDGLKIGISWRGGKDQTAIERRSIDFDLWKTLDHPDVQFVNLQYGATAEELDRARDEFGLHIHDWPENDPKDSLDDLAALLTGLDLVVTVDNSTGHLAGALGVPAWVMVEPDWDWRWPAVFGDGSPFCRSIRVFRADAYFDWQPVMDRIISALETRVAEGGTKRDGDE